MRFNLIFLDRQIRSDIYWAAQSETQSHFKVQADGLNASEFQTTSHEKYKRPASCRNTRQAMSVFARSRLRTG